MAVTNATGGTFKLLWNGQESTEIGYDADAATVAAALAPLVGAVSNISVTGSLGSWTVTFAGTLANAPQPLLQTDVSELIGTDAYVAIAETTLGVVPTGTSGTTAITFSPALTAGTYAATPAITFQPQQVYIKIGDGNLTYTEHRDYQYLLDRGLLDTVREPKDVPMDVKLDAVYEHITSGTSDNVCPMDCAEGAQQRGGMGQFGSRRLRAVLRGRAGGLQPALRPGQPGDDRVPHVPGRDPRDQLHAPRPSSSRASAWPRSRPSIAAASAPLSDDSPARYLVWPVLLATRLAGNAGADAPRCRSCLSRPLTLLLREIKP